MYYFLNIVSVSIFKKFRERTPTAWWRLRPAFDAKAACIVIVMAGVWLYLWTVVGQADTVFVTVVGYADTVFTEHSCATARDSHAIPSSCPPLRVGNHDKQFMSKNLSRSSASFTRCKDTSIPPFGKIKFLTLTCWKISFFLPYQTSFVLLHLEK